MEFLYKFCYGLTVLAGISLGLFVLCKNPRSRVNVTWALTSFAIATWAILVTLGLFEPNYERALLAIRISQYGALLIPVFFTHFCLALLNKPLRESRLGIAGYVFAIGMGGFFLSPWFIPSVSPRLIFRYYPDPGLLYVAFTIQFFALVFYSHWLLFKHLHSQSRERQNQIKYVATGTIIGYMCGSTTFLLAYGIPFNPLPSLFTFGYAAFVTYAIVQHRLMDIKVAITRTGVLLATYLVVLGLPFAVGWWGRAWLQQRVGEGWWLVPLGLCTVLATLGPFAYAYLRRKAEERLLKEQRRYQRVLQHAARGMTQVRNLNRLTKLIVRVVSRTVRVQHATLFLWDKETQRYSLISSHGPRRLAVQSWYRLEQGNGLIQWLVTTRRVLSREETTQLADAAVDQELTKLGAVLVVPGFLGHELIGFLALGEKLSGEGYSLDDLHAFSTLANEAAIAVENAKSYEELLKTHEQLRIAYDRLVQQERLVAAGQFATGMAHEIKNPLSAIKTFAEYLPEKYHDPAFRERFFRIVQAEIERINQIVKELLDFAKPAPLQLQEVRISQLLQDTLALLSNQMLKQGIEVTSLFEDNGLLIQADPKQLRQAFLNLLLNSLEAMPSGGRLEVQTALKTRELVVRVVDTGSGIPVEHHHQIFDPFFTTKERGMGLGLAIVKGVVDRHGGQITVRSQPGVGTTVELALPVAK